MDYTTAHRDQVRACIEKALARYVYRLPDNPTAKTADKYLDPYIQQELRGAGFEVDDKDRYHCLLRPGVPVWRSRLTWEIVPTDPAYRREIDIVAYKDAKVAALIEVEDSLGHLSHNRLNKKKDRYDVLSIDADPDGGYFYSYNSVERMATACRENGISPPLFLVVGCIRKNRRIDDEEILAPRLRNLGVELLYKETN